MVVNRKYTEKSLIRTLFVAMKKRLDDLLLFTQCNLINKYSKYKW